MRLRCLFIFLLLAAVGICSADANAEVNRRKFGGKEFMSDHGYNSYDFAARYLNASYPMFSTRDLLQEIYCPSSPYLFSLGILSMNPH